MRFSGDRRRSRGGPFALGRRGNRGVLFSEAGTPWGEIRAGCELAPPEPGGRRTFTLGGEFQLIRSRAEGVLVSRRLFAGGVAVVTLGALAIRAVHLNWGLPEVFEEATPLREAVEFWGTAGRGLDLNPHFFKYPSLTFYLNFLAQCFWYLWLSLSGAVGSLNEFRQLLAQDFAQAAWLARWVHAVCGALVVVPTAVLGSRLAGRGAGLLAGAVIAALPVAVQESQLIGPDIPLTLFAAAALAAATAVAVRGGRADYLWCGLWIGLATASKYPGALLLAALVIAHALRTVRREGPAGVLLSSLLGQAVFVAAVVFVAATPYVLLDFTAAWQDVVFERRHMALGHLGREEGRAWLFYLTRSFPEGWTLPVAVGSILGAVWLTARRATRAAALPGVGFALLLFVVLGSWKMGASRYLLPLAPLGAAWTGALAAGLASRLSSRPLRAALVGLVVGILILAWPAAALRDRLAGRDREDSRVAAEAWIETNLPEGSSILVERYGPRPDPDRYNVLTMPFHGVQPHLYDAVYSAPLYATFDLVAFSSEVSGRYLAHPAEYPAQVAFYRDMERGFGEAAVFRSGEYLGPTITLLRRREGSGIKELSHIPPEFYLALRGNRPVAEHLSALGTVLVRQGRQDLGFPLLREAVDLDPEDVKTWGNLAVMLVREGNFDAALAAYREARNLEPDNPEVLYNLGTLYQKMGEPSQAADAYRRVLALKPEMEEVYLALARVLVEDTRYAEARVVLREFMLRFPRSGRRSMAEEALRALIPLGPGRP